MTGSSNPIIRKIEKVLRLAANQAGTPEGETAAALASRMMAAHAVEMADLDLDKAGDPDPIEKSSFDSPHSRWRSLLAQLIAEHCQCEGLYSSGRGWQRIHLYGHRSDIEVAKYLYTLCERQIVKAARQYTADLPAYSEEYRYCPEKERRTWVMVGKRAKGNEFRVSAVHGLGVKLARIRAETRRENPTGTALVSARRKTVEQWIANQKDITVAHVRGRDSQHNPAGYEAGQQVNLAAGVEVRR
jgi:hypothetical protein